MILCGLFLIKPYYITRQKELMHAQLIKITQTDLSDPEQVVAVLSEINDHHHYEAEVYDRYNRILYTTYGTQIIKQSGNTSGGSTVTLHTSLITEKQTTLPDGSVYEKGYNKNGDKFLVCTKQAENGLFISIRVQLALINIIAEMTAVFILIPTIIVFPLSLIWVLFFSKKFSDKISSMCSAAQNISHLDFSDRLPVERKDEIGQLAEAINGMSDSLEKTLSYLNDANRKLTSSNTALRDKMQLERQQSETRLIFAANVSHELKTPLAIISGYAEGLKLNINSGSRDEYCNVIIDECSKMNALVAELLTLSRYLSGEAAINPVPFSLREASAAAAERIFLNDSITVSNLIPANLFVLADRSRIDEVFKAYLENAHFHTPPGGTVTLSAESNRELVRFSVKNTGSSISEELLPHIWDSFFRGDAAHSRSENRFGLGLSIVRAIANSHKASCGVKNLPDGVEFWFECAKAPEPD